MIEERIELLDGWVDPVRRRVHREDVAVSLTPREAALLQYLVQHPGIQVTRDQLLQQAFGYAPTVSSRTLDTTVRRLRQKIEPAPSHPQLLLTVHGVGYTWLPPRRGPDVPAVAPVAPVAPFARVPTDRGLFFGRDREQRSILQDLEAGRSVALFGLGGIGKSRLAREVARQWSRRNGVEVHWVAVTDEADLANSVALALGLRLRGADRLEALFDRLKRSPQMLIVLDGVEGIGPAIQERLAVGAGAVRMLSTSRSRPRGPWVVHRVGPLSAESAEALFRHHAAELAGQPMHEVLHRLDGIPLAVVHAARRAAVSGVKSLAGRLETGIEVLSSPGEQGEHGAVQRVLRRSWELSDPSSRRLLGALTAFMGPFDLHDLSQVVRGAEDGLQRAVDAAWVEPSGLWWRGSEPVPVFRVLDCTRKFLAGVVPEAVFAQAGARWTDALATEAEATLDPVLGPTMVEACSWLTQHAADFDGRPALAFGAGHLARLAGDHGRASTCWSEVRPQKAALLRASDQELGPRERTLLLDGVSDPDLQPYVLRERARIAAVERPGESPPFEVALASATGALAGTVCFEWMNHLVGQGAFERAAEVRRLALDQAPAHSLVHLDLLVAGFPMPPEQTPTLEELLEASRIARRIGDRSLLARTCAVTSFAALHQGDLVEAERSASEARQSAWASRSPTGRAGLHATAGVVFRELARFKVAEQCFEAAEAEIEGVASGGLLPSIRSAHALALLDAGHRVRARRMWTTALAESPPPFLELKLRLLQGIDDALTDPERGAAMLRAVLQQASDQGFATEQARAALFLAALDPPDAESLLDQSEGLCLDNDLPELLAVFVMRGERGVPFTPDRDAPDPRRYLSCVRLALRLSHAVT